MAVSPIHSYPGFPSTGVISDSNSYAPISLTAVGTSLAVGTSNVFTSGAGIISTVQSLVVHNKTAGALTISVYVVPASASPGVTHRLYTASVAANTTSLLVGMVATPAIGFSLAIPDGATLHLVGSAAGFSVNGMITQAR